MRTKTVAVPAAILTRVEISKRTPVPEVLDSELEVLARVMADRLGRGYCASLSFVGDRESRSLNREWLAHDWTTDVISFDLTTPGGECSGEIVVNPVLARRVAKRRGVDPRAEILFYVAHGILHLLGYDDATPEEREAMHELQTECLRAAGLPSPD